MIEDMTISSAAPDNEFKTYQIGNIIGRKALWIEGLPGEDGSSQYFFVGEERYWHGQGMPAMTRIVPSAILVSQDLPGLHCDLERVRVFVGDAVIFEAPLHNLQGIGYPAPGYHTDERYSVFGTLNDGGMPTLHLQAPDGQPHEILCISWNKRPADLGRPVWDLSSWETIEATPLSRSVTPDRLLYDKDYEFMALVTDSSGMHISRAVAITPTKPE